MIRPTVINGQPGLIGYLEKHLNEKPGLHQERERKENSKTPGAWYQRAFKTGEVAFVMGLAFAGTQIQEIDVIVNPEKLRHIPARNGDDNGTGVQSHG